MQDGSNAELRKLFWKMIGLDMDRNTDAMEEEDAKPCC